MLEAATLEGPEGLTAVTAHWNDVLPGALEDTIRLFRDRAVGTYLGRVSNDWGGFLVLIYVLHGETQPYVCWYGYLPTEHLDNRMEDVRPGEKADLTQVSEGRWMNCSPWKAKPMISNTVTGVIHSPSTCYRYSSRARGTSASNSVPRTRGR